MKTITVRDHLPVASPAIVDQIFDVRNWEGFTGYGPLPGIKSAIMHDYTPERVGTRFEVTNTDGSTHVETVVECDPERSLVMQMDSFSPPLDQLATHFIERWTFAKGEVGTDVVRSFELYARNWRGRIALEFAGFFLKRAAARHLKSIAAAVST